MLVYQRVITINHSVMPFRSIKSNRIRSSNQASKQSSNQAIKQAINQSINQSINQASNQSINQSISLSLSLTISICFTMGQRKRHFFLLSSYIMIQWYIQHHPTPPRSAAPMICISPRASAGFKMLAASMAPPSPPPPAPTRVWISSIIKMMFGSSRTSCPRS